jgi:Translation initiation factor IF-2, N-terminal region
MTTRVYDISKRLGIEPKVVLATAKKLGITSAKVPSSSLPEAEAELLEKELRKDYPYVPPKASGLN